MKIGFTGTQSAITVAQFDLLTAVIDELEEMTEAHHGDCIGADKVFSELVDAIKFAVVMHTHPPLVEDKRAFCRADVEHEAKDFLVRNHDIVDACDMLIACPKTKEVLRSGTWATIRYARKTNKPIVILWASGKYTYEDKSTAESRETEKDEAEISES